MIESIARRCAYAVGMLTLGPAVPYGVAMEPALAVPGLFIGAVLLLNWVSARRLVWHALVWLRAHRITRHEGRHRYHGAAHRFRE